jgi:hemin uptake protein HemP
LGSRFLKDFEMLQNRPPSSTRFSHTKLRHYLINAGATGQEGGLARMNDDGKEPLKPSSGTPQRPRTLTSQELLQGAREVLIMHGEETYRLRLTRNGKLILHK